MATVTASVASGLAVYSAARSRRASIAYPLQGCMVDAGGVRLHYVEAGSGPTVILLHGNPGTVHSYVPRVTTLLEADHRVLAFDRPGHGGSKAVRADPGSPRAQVAAVREAVRGLGVVRPVVVGHSWAGAMALVWALDFPDEVSGIVLAEGTFYEEDSLLDPFYGPLCNPLIGPALAWIAGPLVRGKVQRRLRQAWAPMAVPESVSARTDALWTRPTALRAIAGDARRRAEVIGELSRRWPEVRVPTVIIACPDDQFVRAADHAYRLHGEVAGSRLVEVPGCGHALPDARPDAVADAVRLLTASIP